MLIKGLNKEQKIDIVFENQEIDSCWKFDRKIFKDRFIQINTSHGLKLLHGYYMVSNGVPDIYKII